MGLHRSSRVDAPVEEVFAWHTRPGAAHRLTPPWMPTRVVTEAGSLRDGVTEFSLPGGLRWRAQHQADGYREGRQFVDRLVDTPGPGTLPWTHTHRFEPIAGGTRIVDDVATPVPERALRHMFTYRHAQLAFDIAAQRRFAARTSGVRTVGVTGSSGLIGTALCSLLTTAGHEVVRLVRRAPRRPDERYWNPEDPDPELCSGLDAVVHLAGSSIAGRFTAAHKRTLRDSRIGPTARLARSAGRADDGPSVFVSASAVGYYGADRGDRVLDESSSPGDDFLARVVADWEADARVADDLGVRSVQVRTGIVQTPAGGSLRLQWPLFALGLGGRLGTGDQWLAWIGIDDLCDLYLRAVLDDRVVGPLNAVAPNPVPNREYTAVLAEVLHRPAVIPVPPLGPALLLGAQGARQLALASQRVVPAKATELGHHFRSVDLYDTLAHLFGRAPRSATGS